jgi:hypothetical protein
MNFGHIEQIAIPDVKLFSNGGGRNAQSTIGRHVLNRERIEPKLVVMMMIVPSMIMVLILVVVLAMASITMLIARVVFASIQAVRSGVREPGDEGLSET